MTLTLARFAPSLQNAPVVSNNAHTSPPEGAADTSSNFYRPRQVRGRSQGSREPHDDQFRNSHTRGRQPWGGGGGLVYTQTFSSRRQPQGRVPSEDVSCLLVWKETSSAIFVILVKVTVVCSCVLSIRCRF